MCAVDAAKYTWKSCSEETEVVSRAIPMLFFCDRLYKTQKLLVYKVCVDCSIIHNYWCLKVSTYNYSDITNQNTCSEYCFA